MGAIPKEEEIAKELPYFGFVKTIQSQVIAPHSELAKEEDMQNTHCPSPLTAWRFLGQEIKKPTLKVPGWASERRRV
jgi:hypothetical protein